MSTAYLALPLRWLMEACSIALDAQKSTVELSSEALVLRKATKPLATVSRAISAPSMSWDWYMRSIRLNHFEVGLFLASGMMRAP